MNLKNKTRSTLTAVYILMAFLFFSHTSFSQLDAVRVVDNDINISEREAIIILPGFGDSKKGRKNQKQFFENKGYDLFIPVYINETSLEKCVEDYFQFYMKDSLFKYKKIHVFSYIIGSWTINNYINKYGIKNVATIVYDRSPIQERAPFIVHRYLTTIGKIKFGPVLKDLAETPYPVIETDSIQIGILIESKATMIMRLYRKKTLKMGTLNWHVDSLYQSYDDYFYTWLNHDQMYERFDVVGEEVLNFIKTGSFTKTARRERYTWNPFKSYKKEGLK
jgi:hypothetical protein